MLLTRYVYEAIRFLWDIFFETLRVNCVILSLFLSISCSFSTPLPFSPFFISFSSFLSSSFDKHRNEGLYSSARRYTETYFVSRPGISSPRVARARARQIFPENLFCCSRYIHARADWYDWSESSNSKISPHLTRLVMRARNIFLSSFLGHIRDVSLTVHAVVLYRRTRFDLYQ